MRVADVLRLAQANVRGHLVRTAMTVLTVSVVFGVMMGANFVLKGVEESLLKYAGEKTDGEAYVVSEMGTEMQRKVMRKYGGEEVGEIVEYEVDGSSSVAAVQPKVIGRFLTTDLDVVPEGKLPIICVKGSGGFKCEDVVESGLMITGNEYEIVGEMPEALGVLKLGRKDLVNLNPLNLVLGKISFQEPYNYLIVEDGTGTTEEFIERVRELADVGWDEEYEEEFSTIEKGLIKFKSAEGAYNYIEEMNRNQTRTRAREIFGNQTSVVGAIKSTERVLRFMMIVLTVVAVVIMALTFAHLMSMEVRTVMLYRSMGATAGQVMEIYLIYLVELCLMAVVVATMVGLLIVGVISLMNTAELKEVLESYYGVTMSGGVGFLRWSVQYFEIAVLMMLMGPVAFLLISDQLTAKRIALKLKEEVGE